MISPTRIKKICSNEISVVFLQSEIIRAPTFTSKVSSAMDTKSDDSRIYAVTMKGVLVNTILTAFKFTAAILGHSAAMLADAAHSLSDLVTDFIVLLFVRIGRAPRDAHHDYGRGKLGTLTALAVGVVIGILALWLCHHGVTLAIRAIRGEVLERPGLIALIAALVSIVVKEWLYRVTRPVAEETKSSILHGNAWHHRSDALSSIGTFLGISAAMFFGVKWRIVDPITSVVVSVFILRISWLLLSDSVRDLLEHSLSDQIEAEITQLALSEPEVTEVKQVLSRRVGQSTAIELQVSMPRQLSIEEAHRHALNIENLLKGKFGTSTHVGIHIVPDE